MCICEPQLFLVRIYNTFQLITRFIASHGFIDDRIAFTVFFYCLIFVGVKIHMRQLAIERVLHPLQAAFHITCCIAWLEKISSSLLALHWPPC